LKKSIPYTLIDDPMVRPMATNSMIFIHYTPRAGPELLMPLVVLLQLLAVGQLVQLAKDQIPFGNW
jgi:hypothetical protein